MIKMDALIFIDTNIYLDFYEIRKADIFDYIETFYNQRKKRKLGETDQTALN